MSDFAVRVEAFLAEFFRLDPTFATAIGEHAHDGRWPDLTAAGRAERLAFTSAGWPSSATMTDLAGDEAIDRDLLIGELEAERFADDGAARGRLEPARLGLPARRRPVHAHRPRVRAARRPPGVDRRPAREAARPSSTRRGRRSSAWRAGPVGRFQTETALEQLPGIEELIADALARGRRRRADRCRRRRGPARG